MSENSGRPEGLDLQAISAVGTKLPLSPVIVSRINRSVLKNYVLLRGAFLFPPPNISPYSPFFIL